MHFLTVVLTEPDKNNDFIAEAERLLSAYGLELDYEIETECSCVADYEYFYPRRAFSKSPEGKKYEKNIKKFDSMYKGIQRRAKSLIKEKYPKGTKAFIAGTLKQFMLNIEKIIKNNPSSDNSELKELLFQATMIHGKIKHFDKIKATELNNICEAMPAPHPDKDCPDCDGEGSYESNYNPDARWDFWIIGGRWSGFFDLSYDPNRNPDNWEFCSICGGTGFRNDSVGREARKKDASYTCNACGNARKYGAPLGYRIKWPTEWNIVEGDTITADEYIDIIKNNEFLLPNTIITPDGTWIDSDEHSDSEWKKTVLKALSENNRSVAVACDLHM